MNLPDLTTYLPKPGSKKDSFIERLLGWLGYLVIAFGAVLFLTWLLFGREPLTEPDDIEWGVTYSQLATEGFAMNSDEVYRAVIDDLKPDKIRLAAYWNRIESNPDQYDFSVLDEQVRLAAEADIPFVISVGRRVPRYPECHAPTWVDQLPQDQQDLKTLEFIQRTMDRYDDEPLLDFWQIENEPLLGSFGICPTPREKLLEKEIDLARSLTDKQIMTTESGELSFWLKASNYPDILGTTLYRRVIVAGTNVSINHIFPAWYYRARSNIVKSIHGNLDKVIVAELQAEPWSNVPIIDAELDDIERTMNREIFEDNISFTEAVGFPEVYLWGVEWWYYEKEVNNNDYYWERARQLFN